VNKGAKNTINISNDTFLSKAIVLPTDEYTKERLVVIFDGLCTEVGLLEERLEMAKLNQRAIMKLLLTGVVRVNED
jgi:type I restriction enzyme S subunit